MAEWMTATELFAFLWHQTVVLRLPPDALPYKWELQTHYPGAKCNHIERFWRYSQVDIVRCRLVCETFTAYRLTSCQLDLMTSSSTAER